MAQITPITKRADLAERPVGDENLRCFRVAFPKGIASLSLYYVQHQRLPPEFETVNQDRSIYQRSHPQPAH